MTALDTDKLSKLHEAATPGPYDTMPGSMVRALRGDLAVPMFESRCVIWDPANEGPTVRDGSGAVQMRKGSEGAKISQGMRREHANVELVAELLNSVSAILEMAEENRVLRESLGFWAARQTCEEAVADTTLAPWRDCSPEQRLKILAANKELHDGEVLKARRALGKDKT